MKLIPLTQGKFAMVDDSDFEWLNQWKWYALKSHNTWYAVRNIETGVDGKQERLYMHRIILSIDNPKTKGDHRDHDGLNNQRENLRLCTDAQNQANRRSSANGTSKYLGVSWYSRDKVWKAQINKYGKTNHLGYFKNEIDAAIAYNNAAKKLHGEFANLNII